jgi:hypothetical protein
VGRAIVGIADRQHAGTGIRRQRLHGIETR